jgi:NTP pyrophosphatase (non-canonical NTP hydrolase)
MKRPDLLPVTFEGKVGKVIEEAGEVLQAIGKAQRHGWQAEDPVTGIKYDNLSDLKNELLDLQHSIQQVLDSI